MRPALWKVGELAKETGVSVRTLHYYEEIGLLQPSHRSETGHRLYAAPDIVRLQEIKLQRKLVDRLEALAEGLRSREKVSIQEFIQTIEVISISEKYYTPEQLKEIKARGQKLGAERIHQAEAEWKELIEQVRVEMEKGADPASKSVQRLAKRWMGLIQEFTGGNPEIEKSLRTMYQQEPTIHDMETRSMREMMAYISKAIKASKKSK